MANGRMGKPSLVLAGWLGFEENLLFFLGKAIVIAAMGKKAAELAAMLKNKKIFYVNIEQPNNKGSTKETVIEDPQGVFSSIEGDIITFKGNGKTASFAILDNAQIIDKKTDEGEVISTFAENGGLQIKSKN